MTIDELQVLITANTSALRNEITKAQSSLTGLSKTSDKTANTVSKGFNFIKASIIGAGIGVLLHQITGGLDEAISRVDTLNNYSRTMSNLGIGAEASERSINRLSDALLGLPTRLDDAVSSVQRFASANSNIEASTEMFLAMNNAILAGGASQQVQANAVEQLSQAYAKNKMEMQEWRSIMMAMPAQLKQVALAMNFSTTEQLGESLRNGETSMNDFMLTMIRLNQEGANGFQSFEQQARNATGGIGTSITNVRTAFTRGLADIMDAIGQSNIAGFFQGIASAINSVVPYITAFVKVCATAVNYISSLFGVKTKKNVDSVNQSLTNLGTSAGTTTAEGLDNATGSAKKLNKELNGLASFDEMNVLKENTGSGSTGGSSGGSTGGVDLSGIDFSDINASMEETTDKLDVLYQKMLDSLKWFTSDMDFMPMVNSLKNLGGAIEHLAINSGTLLEDFIANCLKPLSTWTINDGLPHFFNSTADAIRGVDFDTVSRSLNRLYDAIVPFGINVGEGLLWFYDNVLIPLGLWTINDVVPQFLNMLSNGITILNNTIDTVKPAFSFLWDNFLEPIASWTGGMVVNVLNDINTVLGLIAKNKVASTITAIATGFTLLKNSGNTLGTMFTSIKKKVTDFGDSLSQKTTGLGGILNSAVKSVKNFLSPTKNLITNITDASSRTKALTKEIKNNGNQMKTTTSLMDKFKSAMDKAKTSANNLKTSITNVGTKFKDMTTQLKDGINYWYQTTSGIDKLKTGLVGLGGSVISLQGVSTAIKDISTNGANLGNVSTTVVSGLGAITSAATTGASVGGVYGAVIGGIAGTLGVIATGLFNWNSQNANLTATLEASSSIYQNYKEQMDSINSSLQTSIATSQQNAEVKMTEIANAQQLATELESIVDVNGRVTAGNEERANVILTTLNEALGTQLTLEGNVIRNGTEIINSKEQFIDVINRSAEAIQKETLLQSYQAQYKSAIEAQTQAKQTYNQAMQDEIGVLEEAVQKYKDGKISAEELQKVYDDAVSKTNDATKKYQEVLNDTNGIIDGLKDVTEAFADGSYDDMKRTVDSITSTNKKSTGELETNYKNVTNNIKSMLDEANKKAKDAKKSLDDMKNQHLMPTFDLDTSPARRKFNALADDINRSSNATSGFNIKVNRIPQYAQGGIIDKPTVALVGEAGREAVMPLERNTGWIDELALKLTEKGGNGGSPIQLVVKIGEDTILDKVIDGMREKDFETNGEVFNL